MELLGVFNNIEQAAASIDEMVNAGIDENRITSLTSVPYPEGVLIKGHPRHWFHWVSLAGGLLGAALGFLLAAGTAWLYPLRTGEKPIIALFPTGIVTYEMAMLFALIGTIVGMLLEMRLPPRKKLLHDPAIADGLIGVSVWVSDAPSKQTAETVLRRHGAIRVLSDEVTP